MRYIGWEDRVFFITPPHIFRGFISVCGGWMLLCKEFIMAEQSPRQCIMTGRINAIIYLKNSKDKHSVSTQVWSITAVAMCAHKHCTNPKWSITAWLISYQIFNAQSTVKIVLYIYIYIITPKHKSWGLDETQLSFLFIRVRWLCLMPWSEAWGWCRQLERPAQVLTGSPQLLAHDSNTIPHHYVCVCVCAFMLYALNFDNMYL